MRTSKLGVQLICEFEGYRNCAYPDVVGVWTIGYGTTRVNGKPVTKTMTCTEEQAREWLFADLAQFEDAVNKVAPATITQNQFDACVCLAYNIGANAFLGSTIARKLQSGNAMLVSEANFTAWNKVHDQGGELVESRGLTRRRKAEYHLFSTGVIQTQFKF